MKKFTIIFLFFNVVLFSFLACKTDASSSEPGPIRKVTVIPNGGSGLSTEEYQVESGKTLNALSNMPTMTYATFTGFTDTDGNPFKLGETTVNNDMTIVMQWKWNDFSDCTNKKAGLQASLDANDVWGVACAVTAGASLSTDIAGAPVLLYAAIRAKDPDMLKYLLEQGLDVKQADMNGNTALLFACTTGTVDTIKFLQYKGANLMDKNIYGRTVLFNAAQTGNLDVVKYVIANGVSVSDRDSSDGTSPFLAAAKFGKLETVKYLLTLNGVNINEKSNNGMTALMNAVSLDGSGTFNKNADYLAIVKYLATYPGVSLKETVNAGIYALGGLDALGLAKKTQDTLRLQNSTYLPYADQIVDYLTSIW